MKVLKIILAIILPPVAAFMQVGLTAHFWINLVLCLFFVFPGVIHALWLVLTDKKK
ncbi:MAG: YqaE/Pmp3 family membrane protein [Candidatus Omnitrophica bacterium]|nr:YqaE/Pmp3 family membrane protein [Candidatus Omnitrophota bacterium]MDD5512525.1 YqaE/Pmp3 family membrane protein [Candidatus Omnitrophota bacterium]